MMQSTEQLTIHPELALEGLAGGDLLSQVLARIRLTGDRVYATTLAAAARLELAAQTAHVCVVNEGAIRVTGEIEAPVTIQSGDLVLLPHGPRDLQLTAGESPAAVVVCRFWFDPDSLQDMLFALPMLIHLRQAEASDWLTNIFHFILREADDAQPGSSLMISRLIDLVVIRTLRTWVHRGHASSWLGGLADARIARVLKSIHEQPVRPLTIDALAAVAGMSRSSFCERFTALVGQSPLRYRNEWRLTVARDMLAKGTLRIGEVGIAVGYESEAAFSRAYKAFFGHTPRDAKPAETRISTTRSALTTDSPR
jgi:AraC-like DNA-binding protein